EPFDLVDDRLGRVAGEAVRDVAVGPDRMDVAARAARIGEVLLADEYERPLGHPAAVDVALGGDDLPEGAGGVDGPGAARALDREVDLEGAGAMAVSAQAARRPGRDPRAGDLGDGARGEVEDDRVDGRELVERADRAAGLDRPPALADDGGEGVGDRLRPS